MGGPRGPEGACIVRLNRPLGPVPHPAARPPCRRPRHGSARHRAISPLTCSDSVPLDHGTAWHGGVPFVAVSIETARAALDSRRGLR